MYSRKNAHEEKKSCWWLLIISDQLKKEKNEWNKVKKEGENESKKIEKK